MGPSRGRVAVHVRTMAHGLLFDSVSARRLELIMSGLLSVLDTVMWGVITFSILVVMHEGGHFLAARAFGVKVHEFMIGLPGPSLRFHAKDVDWGITAVPLGGYVRIAGMEPGPEDPLIGETLVAVRDHGISEPHALGRYLGVDEDRAQALLITVEDWKAVSRDTDDRLVLSVDGDTSALSATELADRARSVTYRGQSTWKRVTILSAGVLVNLLTAILTFTVFLSVWGYYEVTTTIDNVDPGTPAEAAGILPGDTLITMDGDEVGSWVEFQTAMAATKPAQTITLGLERAGEVIEVDVTLADREGHGFVGVGPRPVKVDPTVLQSLGKSLEMSRDTFVVVLGLFDPSRFAGTVEKFTGPVGLFDQAKQAAHAGPIDFAYLIAAVSLSLGIINILPLPPLDGGKVVLEFVERIAGRPLSRNVSLGLSTVGAVLLFSLIGYLTFMDIGRLAG